MIIKDLGAVTAYAYAVEKGYTGTEEEFATLMASYATVAEEAAESAESASQSASTASASAQTATSKANEATTAAQTAAAKAEEAQADADAAALDASQALSAASTATTKASEAAQSASDAVTAKTAAQTAQTAAEGSATTAQTAAQAATQKAAEAAESARTLTIDPTLTQSGQAADAKATGDRIEGVKSGLNELKTDLGENITIINRFDKTKAVDGRITDSGVDTSVTREFTSDYIDVSNVDSIVVGRYVSGGWHPTNCYYVLYDVNKNKISDRAIGSSIDTSEADYVRFTGGTNYIDVFMLVSSDYIPTQYVPYSRNVSFSYVDNKVSAEGATKYTKGRIGEIAEENTSFFNFSGNRLDLTKVTVNKTLNSDGTISDSDASDITNYCYIGDFSTVYLGRFRSVIIYDTMSQYCILYDADKNKISDRIAIPKTGLDISSYNATFIRCNLPHNRDYPVVLVSSAPSIYEKFEYKFKYQPKDPLYGKKWAVCGDSFTWGGYSPMNLFTDGICYGKRKVYPYFIRQRTGIEIYDFSLGGRTLAYPSDGTFENSLTNPSADYYYQNIPADSDYITIYLGINDFGHQNGYGQTQDGEDATGVIELGTIDDNTTDTYYGAWNVVLTWLITNRPFAHIGIIVTNGTQNQQYTEAQINIAKKYGIPYLNMNGDERTPAMIRCYNPNIPASIKTAILEKQRVSSSNTHPNDNTHEYESHFIEAWLRTL